MRYKQAIEHVFGSGTETSAAPDTEPITRAQAKAWLKIDSTADDDLIDDLIEAVRSDVESMIGIALYTQTCKDYFDEWPKAHSLVNKYAAISLLRYPVQSVTSITYVDDDGNTQTLDASKYIVDTSGPITRIAPAAEEEWPDLDDRIKNVTVEYTAGYTSQANIPANLKLAVRLMLTRYYEMRSDPIQERTTAAELIIRRHYPIIP